MTVTLVQARISWFVFDTVLLLALFLLSRFPFRALLRELGFWLFLLVFLFLFQALLTPGTRLESLSWAPVSEEGLILGGLTCWRLGLILGYAVLFTAVTRPRELRDALIWLLRPIPFIPERRIGLMVSLTLRFFSRTLDQAEEVHLANRARLGDQRKNPLRRIKNLALPVLRRSLTEAEEVTLALVARGYREDLPIQLSAVPLSHWLPLLLLLGFFVATR